MDAVEPKKAFRKKKSELDIREIPINQQTPLKMPPLHENVERASPIVVPEVALTKSDFDELAFNEEPVKILIHRGDNSKFRCTDYVAINGTAGEILFKNGWVPVGYFPRGVSFYTKRKYVGVLARAKQDNIRTDVIERDNEDPENYIEKTTISALSFSVMEDKNPRGSEWLELLVRENSQ